ncbi:MAG TPA: hypothetical protein VFF88_11270 [Methylocella sp.]|nr:hypothetical protein [Methylocella sp.]
MPDFPRKQNMAFASVSVAGTAVKIADFRLGRHQLMIEMGDSVADVFLGNTSSVTPGTGYLLVGVKGAMLPPLMMYEGPVYGITAGGTAAIKVIEVW